MPNTYSTRPITPPFATPQSARESSRLIPYAKDHDRLQLALLYIESNASQLKDISELELRMLNSRKESLEKAFKDRNLNKEKEAEKYLRTHHPANYTNISGNKAFPGSSSHSHIFRPSTPSPDPNDRQFKAARDQKLKSMFREERLDEQEYAAVMAQLEYIDDLRTKVKEGVEQKKEILKLIEELYATAFDGVTPEFPHEDELEGLVAIAEASLRGEEQALEGISREIELNKLVTPAEDAHNVMNTIREHAVRLFDKIRMQHPYDTQAFFAKEMASIQSDDQCHRVASWCDKLREDLSTYLAKNPKSAFRQTIKNELGEVPELIPVFTGEQLVHKLNEAGKGGASAQLLLAVLGHLIKKLANIVNALTQAFKVIERKVMAGKQAVQTAKIVLDLRRRQLAAARCHILDHVVDPDKCPLEQRADKLPEYPEDISTFSIGGGHPRARQLLQQAERHEPEEYVDDIVRSRLNRARRTTHPPILSAERYQPPGYGEPEDAKHRSRIIPPKGGLTPAYTEEPDYGEYIQTDRAHIKSVVLDGELGTVVRNARAGLFPTQPAFDSWVQELLTSAQASGFQIFTISPSRHR